MTIQVDQPLQLNHKTNQEIGSAGLLERLAKETQATNDRIAKLSEGRKDTALQKLGRWVFGGK